MFQHIVIGAFFAAIAVAEEPARTIFNDSDYTAVKGTPISLVVPGDYVVLGDGKSFHHKTLNSDIQVLKFDAPYAEVSKVFTVDELATRGMRLLGKDNVTTSGRAALLMHVAENTPEAAIFRWTLVLGDYQETYLVNGTYAKADEGAVSATLRNALMTARWTKRAGADPFVNFNFSVEPTPKLVHSPDKDLDTLVVFTKDGVFPLEGPGDPLFLAGYEMNEEKITDERAFAAQALSKVPHCKDVKSGPLTSITLGGLNGFEAIADAKDESSGTPLKVYQTLLFAQGHHIFLLGIVDIPRSEEYLTEFKATARTFKTK